MRCLKTAKPLAYALSLFVILFAWPARAIACSCDRPSAKDAVEASLLAFRGTVAKVEYLDPDTPQTEPRIIVTFSVSRVWKGPARREVVLHTIYNKYLCEGYYFKKGNEYLVFAYRNHERTLGRGRKPK